MIRGFQFFAAAVSLCFVASWPARVGADNLDLKMDQQRDAIDAKTMRQEAVAELREREKKCEELEKAGKKNEEAWRRAGCKDKRATAVSGGDRPPGAEPAAGSGGEKPKR